jgi:ribosomal protein S18 acetylase RimI-like enzyme
MHQRTPNSINLATNSRPREVNDGRTYPQEEITDLETYKSYFMAYDLVLGFFLTEAQLQSLHPSGQDIALNGVKVPSSQPSSPPTINLPNASDTYAFAYYIKPNYPGRSSHLCNGGFMVPSASRGLGLGRIAARSFLFYAPACGYRGSVFNLVYVDNEASVKLWEKLGFSNVGRIPGAGRLRKKDGDGEEYVDAWVVHGDFAVIGVRDEE